MSFKKLFDLSGKNVLITGAAGILGEQFCHGFAEFEANVIAVDIHQEGLSALVSNLRSQYDIKAVGIVCDVSSPHSVNTMLDKAITEFSSIDVLMNNAATKTNELDRFLMEFKDYDLQTWRDIMAVNLDGMFLMAQAVGGQMVQQKAGSIIQTASIYGVLAPDNRIYEGSEYLGKQINTPLVYSASKAGVVGMSRHLAAMWAEQGIRVNTLTPGGVFSGQNDEFQERYSGRIPMGRMANKQEMVGTALFLASEAASYITGQNIMVDGGLSVW